MMIYETGLPSIQVLNPCDDLQALRIWNQAVTFDLLSPALFCEKVRLDPDMAPAYVLGVYAGRDLIGWAGALIRRENGLGYVKMIAIDPRYRRLGLGSVLLHELEQLLLTAGVSEIRVGESAPNYLQPGIDERYEGACQFFEKAGYQRFDTACNMLVDLTSQVWLPWPHEQHLLRAGINFRRAVSADWPPLLLWLSNIWPSWVPEVRQTFRNKPVSLYLAHRGDDIVGFSAYDANNLGTGWFGPMGTDPSQRGSGIGTALLFRCLSDLQAQGRSQAVIPWVGPTGFYAKRAGASIERTFIRFHKIFS